VRRINLRKLNELEVRKQYQFEITKSVCSFKNVSDGEGIIRAWENIKLNTKTSAKESLGVHEVKQHIPWFDEKCLEAKKKKCNGYRFQVKTM